MIKDIKIGKMLIQSENKAPRLHYCSLHNILSPNNPVLLLDATLATGSTVKMAVRVLLDHGVKEEDIYFLTIVSSPQVLALISLIFFFFSFKLLITFLPGNSFSLENLHKAQNFYCHNGRRS